MSRSSVRRAQVEPLAALAAVFVLGTAVATYAIGLGSVLPDADDRDRDLAPTTLDAVLGQLADDGVVDPGEIGSVRDVGPAGYHLRVSVTAGDDVWGVGPDPPDAAETATAPVSVRRWPGRVDAGRIRVEVWP